MALPTIARWSASHPAIALSLVFAVTAGLGAGLAQMDPGRVSELFVPDDLEAQKTLERIEAIWGETDGSFFLYIVDDPTDPALLRAAADDAFRLQAEERVVEVSGLPVLLEERLGTLDVPDGQLRAAAQEILESPAGSGLAAEDAILLRISTERSDDIADTVAILDDIAERSAVDVRATGVLHIEQAQQTSGDQDVGILMPLSVGTLILVLSILFRRVQDVAAPLTVSFLAIAMAYGTVAWFGLPLAPPSFVVMPLLLGLGIDYMLHIIYAYREQPMDWDVPSRFAAAAGRVGAPVFFTAVTTLIGFGSFLASNIPQIRVWGLLIGSGALYAFLLGFVALPALYRIGRGRKFKARRLPFGGLLDAWSKIVIRERRLVLLAVGGVTIALAVGATLLDVEAELDFELDDDLDAVADLNAIEDRFGGQTTAQVLLPADDRQQLEELEAALAVVPGVGFVDGPIQRLERAGTPDAELPTDATDGVATQDHWRVIVGYPEGAATTLDGIRDAADVPGARVTGRDLVQIESQATVLDSLFLSTGIALALVLVLLFTVFRNVPNALLAFAPLAMTIVWQIGIQALVGIPLNPITGVITAMTLGIGVDYALHIMNHFQGHLTLGRQEAARRAVASVGRPVLAASLTTVFAFSVLGFSSLLPLQQFGYTAAIVITCAFIVSLTFLPAVASLGKDKAAAVGEPRILFVERGVPVDFEET